jgi:hypothetical protein
MSLFLLPNEIEELTGLQQSSAQRRWLDANKWIYQIDVRGRPKIARIYFNQKMTEQNITPTQELSNYSVNVLALRRA